MTTEERWGQGDELVQARWSTSQVRMEQSEIVEGIMYALLEVEAAFGVLAVAQRFLHVTEETAGAGDGKRHGPEFAYDLVPALDRGSFLRQGNLRENVGEAL